MNLFLFFIAILSLVLSAQCPNDCSGHGSCTKSQTCSCYDGYTFGDCSGRTCAFGNIYVNPDSKSNGLSSDKDESNRFLECSGKGVCDRSRGVCECFEGFEGDACNRLSCPNNCNNHGLCVPVKHLTLNSNSDGSSQYEKNYDYALVDNSAEYSKQRKDGSLSYACVCDGEYEGYDCSEKKCASGYSATSDCEESSSKSVQKFSGLQVGTSENGRDSTNAYKCLAYLEYTDMLGRKWYSDRFCTYCEAYNNPSGNAACTQTGILGWKEALKRLPVGVIDPDTTVKCIGGSNHDECKEVEITFGSQQTGRQNPLKLITYTDLTDSTTGKLYPGGNTPSGFHGMSTTEIPDGSTKTAIQIGGTYYYISYGDTNKGDYATTSGVKPTVCAGNGECNKETGLCDCYSGFYGIACTMTEDMM